MSSSVRFFSFEISGGREVRFLNERFSAVILLLGSAEGHEYHDLQVGDEVDHRLFLIPIKIYNIDPL